MGSIQIITFDVIIIRSFAVRGGYGQVSGYYSGRVAERGVSEPLGISQYRLAKEIGVPAQRIGQIVLGNRRITADTDLRLCRFFGLSDGSWLRAQEAYDLEVAREKIAPVLKRIKPWSGKAACL